MRQRSRLARVASIASIALAAFTGSACADDRSDRLADFDAFCRFVGDEYAYFDVKKTDWPAVCAASRPAAADAATRASFVTVLEGALGALYDAHAHLGTSTRSSPRLVPTDTDLFATWHDERAVLVDVRARSAGWAAGLRPGMEVVEIDGRPVAVAIDALVPKHLVADDPDARAWALQVALAGRQDGDPVRLVVADAGRQRRVDFVPRRERPDHPLSVSRIDDVGIVEVHNALGDFATVAAFDAALDALDGIVALVLDLRDTPSGGNTAVGRGLMSRLVAHEAAYQRHERVADARATGVRRVWIEQVEPRGRTFDRPVVVLVGHWTGSMGEGIAIGLDAARDAPVVGRSMAGLSGALDEIRLPLSRIVVRVPAEKLSHVDGTPRERFVPCPLDGASNDDAELRQAVKVAARLASDATRPGGARPAPGCPSTR